MTKELTPLEALEKIVDDHCIDNEDEELDIIEKELKALEIIKENLNIDEILFSLKGVASTKDYDLVKEVLKDE